MASIDRFAEFRLLDPSEPRNVAAGGTSVGASAMNELEPMDSHEHIESFQTRLRRNMISFRSQADHYQVNARDVPNEISM